MDDDNGGDHVGDLVDEERLVLSEVHLGDSASDESEVVSRYTYLKPGPRDHLFGDTTSSSSRSTSSDSSDSEGHSSGITRPRKRRRSSTRSHKPRSSRPAHEVLTVVHRLATTLELVGQQVWSAAFLLGDFVLAHEEVFRGAQVLELGAGPGVAGLVAARLARRCYLTDYHDEVLELLARNADANQHLFAHEPPSPADASAVFIGGRAASSAQSHSGGHQAAPTGGGTSSVASSSRSCPDEGKEGEQHVVAVRKLDWFTFSTQEADTADSSCTLAQEREKGQLNGNSHGQNSSEDDARNPFAWRNGELEALSSGSENGKGLVIVASDVIYDEGLTEALFLVLGKLMPAPFLLYPKDENNNTGCDTERQANCNTRTLAQAPFRDVLPSRKDEAVLFLALEKRFNFSLETLTVAATGYQALVRNVLDITDEGGQTANAEAGRSRQEGKRLREFEGTRVPLTFSSCFRYRRSESMELWEIRRRPVVAPPEVRGLTTNTSNDSQREC